MITMTLAELAVLLTTECAYPTLSFRGLSKDNRRPTAGTLYVAIQGENFDGHDFVADAIAQGAVAALVSRPMAANLPHLVVPDTLAALALIVKQWRNQFSLPLIGVTGSNGKTTSKNMIGAILTAACQGDQNAVIATQGNLNNAIGVPFTLANLAAHHCYGVIEMGMNNPGEIAYLAAITQPQVAIVTNAAESHLQGLQDVAGVAREKGDIFAGLPSTGTAIINRDDAFYASWRERVAQLNVVTFGLDKAADVTATLAQNPAGVDYQQITLHTPQGEISLRLPLLGLHNVRNALGAAAACLAVGIDLAAIKAGLENILPTAGRMTPHVLSSGVRIIDDTYNANPFSTHAAIHTLAAFPGTRILVLADMRELGPDALLLHTLTGERALAAGIDHVFTYGDLAAAVTQAFGTPLHHYTDRAELVAALQPYLKMGTTVLVKGSRSMKMELILAKLLPNVAVEAH